jgi:hypothetical protein
MPPGGLQPNVNFISPAKQRLAVFDCLIYGVFSGIVLSEDRDSGNMISIVS